MESRRVALTFDAEHADRRHPPGATEAILACLREVEARATFFVQGRWAQAFPDTARRIASDGHRVASHSHYHVGLPLLTPAGLHADLRAAEAAIRATTGVDPRPWFRWPFGAGAEDPGIGGLIEAAGYRPVGWHVDAGDWRSRATAASVARSVVDGALAAGDGCVVLLHGWPAATAAALPAILRLLREADADLVTIDDLPDEMIPRTVPWS
jgi:peptidoglycan/xylan/chitin deacetylase (PgdA/CDA1 family)